MLYTHKLTFDLKEQKPRQRIPVSYGSRETIAVELSVFDGTDAWPIPAGTACVIRYMKANGNGGVYHVLADGGNAWYVEENRASVMIITEALDVPGLVDISVAMVNNGRTLCIHGFDIHVDSNLLMPLEETGNVLEFSNLSEINTALAALQRKTDVDATLTAGGRPADAAAVGAIVAQLSADKAPAGYGLGGGAKQTTDFNDACASGWYFALANSASNMPDDRNMCIVESVMYNHDWVVQKGYSMNANYPNVMAQAIRYCQNKVWTEWEWINPTMDLGVEYRTTERWQGKAVYTMMFDFGAMPTKASTKEVSFSDDETISRVIRCSASTNADVTNTLPSYNEGAVLFFGLGRRSVVCNNQTNWNMSYFSAQVQVWYVKD